MKFRKTSAGLGLALSAALLLGACTSPEAESPSTPSAGTQTTGGGTATGPEACMQDVGITETKEGQVSYTGGPGDWTGYNSVTSKTYSTYNSAVSAHMFSGFVYFGTDGTICNNEAFGTFEVTSEDPMVVEYTISDEAVWSDGTPVTVNDFLLDWAAQNPEFLVPGFANGENPDATAIFDHVSSSFAEFVPEGPVGEVNGKTFTTTYTAPYPDYKLMVTPPLPAHIVAQKSGLEPDALAQAILDRDAETVKQAADFWNTGWLFEGGQLPDMSEVPSSGPYKLKEGGWQSGNSLTLEANDKYWGTPAGTENLIFRFIEDAQMAQALQNGDVQVINPQPTVDTLTQLDGIGDSVNVDTYETLTWEHLDFNFRSVKDAPKNVFADDAGGIALREAFAYCVPRQTIVDNLIKPINPDAVVMNAREVFPFQQPKYDEVVAAAYDGRFDEVDIEKSKEKVAESGVATPIDVRLGYRAGNQRRADQVAQIAASCKDAGFNVIDSNSESFFETEMPNGDYEVALYAWAGSGQITSGQNIYGTNKAQNFGKYSNETVDQAWATLTSTLDEDVHLEQTKIIEKELWDTLFGIPIFAHPGLSASASNVQNVRSTATQDQVVWNAPQWVLS
ncbi:peptide/nickel transport system substrate-binding protein [Tessaracoccus bendigoensis DSM 12906]|uniref:Peptide/nickel transport system substrate-binding protein n=1 Tax=Tessaracoccus bendigoensis DSM 12906 TaxID=1123357 RepID=A0A1M6MY73_9ACTN|nr:ABC transporter family substrate-binding protein [Tessaracoccus bendigoensis]SHJ88396.1 peptide/nickel transport system substrate-binding protein [Tessaracoccus bendigoensis DSM 12906]